MLAGNILMNKAGDYLNEPIKMDGVYKFVLIKLL